MTTSSIRLLTSETRDLTPGLAVEFSQMPASVTERDLEPKRLKFLRDTIQNGIVLPFQWATATVLTDGARYRVNGHHSSHVLAEMNGDMPEGLRVHIDEWEVSDIFALPQLFRQFDTRKSTRSLDDIAGAYQMVEADLVSIPRRIGKRAIDGLAWYERRIFGSYIPTGDEQYALFHNERHHPFIKFAGAVLSVKTPEFTTQVVGAMFATFELSPDASDTFWQAVATQGVGYEERHPATVLDAWLLAAKDKPTNEKPGPLEVFRACVVAWNAFRNNRDLDRIGRYDPKKGWPDVSV